MTAPVIKSKCTRWTAEEHAILLKNLKTYPKRQDAIAKTAEKTGRTFSGVSWRADHLAADGTMLPTSVIKGPKNTAEPKPDKFLKAPVITYHNGTTRKAQVLINTKNLIVAKFDDVVITIEF